MLSSTAVPSTGPPLVAAEDETLNLVLQPATGGALGSLAGLIAQSGASVEATGIPGYYVLEGPAAAVGSLATTLSANPAVEYAAPPRTITVADAPNNPAYVNDTQWYLDGPFGINAPGAWSLTSGSTQVIVADTDTGIAYNDTALLDNIWINQAEIPASVRPNLTDTNGDGLITFADLNAIVGGKAINQGPGKIEPIGGSVDGSAVLASRSAGGWADGSTQDGDTLQPDDLIGWNFSVAGANGNGDNSPLDQDNHGTFTAGEIAAVGNDAAGTSGALWSGQIMPVQFLNSSGSGTDTAAAAAIEYAVDHGAKVINASWGGSGTDPVLASAIQYADQYGVIIVAAAGNSGTDNDNSSTFFAPASYSVDFPNLIAVAATDINGNLAGFSNYGVNSVQIAAPGNNLYGTVIGGYGTFSGTSMAAPLVTATVALVEAAHPTWSMTQVVDAVLDTATPDSKLAGKVTSGGIVNAAAAVNNPDGPYIVSSTPSGAIAGGSGLSTIQVTFNEEVNPATFTPSQVTLAGPSGAISGISVAAVAGSNDHTFDISVPSQSAAGAYTLKVGPDIEDWYGNDMDQNRNGINGEPSDAFVKTINRASSGSSDVFSLTGIPESATAGTSYTLTVTALSPSGGTDTSFVGTVDFSSTDPQIAGLPASATFASTNDGTRTFTVTLKTAGTQSISATEASSPAVAGSESNILVHAAAAKSLVVSDSGTPTAGEPSAVTVTAIDAYGNVANGYIGTIALSSSDPAASLPMTYEANSPPTVTQVPATDTFAPELDGTATFYVIFETPGKQSLTATDTATSSITGAASNINVAGGLVSAANPDATTTTFANPTGSSMAGQTVTLTATVASTASGAASPTDGAVIFYQGTTALGTVSLNGSDQASFTTGPLSPGTYSFFAAYDGDATTYKPSASPVFTQVVNHFATNLTLSASSGNPNVGQPLSLTATVTIVGADGASPPTPTGTVTFYDGTTALGTAGLNSADQATITTSALPPGPQAIVAVYNGDGLTQTNQSPTLVETVVPTSPAVVYVNSAWAGDASGTQVSAGTTTLTIGTNAFATIQAGIDGVAAGGTVNVMAGTYAEQDTIDQSLTLTGAGVGATVLSAPSGASGGSQIAIDGGPSVSVTISGVTLSGSLLLTGIGDDTGGNLTLTGDAESGDDVGVSVLNGSTATITGGSTTGDNTGIWVANAGTATVTQSAVNGCMTGILVGNGGGDISTLTAERDDLSGNVMGVEDLENLSVTTAPAAVATFDWWGSAGGPGSSGSSAVSGPVNDSPWLGDSRSLTLATPDSLGFSTMAGNAWTVSPNNSGPSLNVALGGTATGTVAAGGSIQFTGSGGTLTIDGESGTGYTANVFDVSNNQVQFAAGDAYGGSVIGYSGITDREVYAEGTANTFNIAGTGAGGTGGNLWGASSATNAFIFSGSSTLAGNIEGSGTSTLSYAGYASGVSVNLASGTGGTATGVGGTVAGITAIIGSAYNDTLNAGSVGGVTLTGGLGSNTLSGTGTSDAVVESFASGYTLSNSSLTATNVSLTDNLSGITAANLTDTSSGHTFNITGWTGNASLSGTGETLVDSVPANVALTNSSLAVSGLPAIALTGFTTANLSDAGSGHTFTITGWTGNATLSDTGTGDTVAESVSTNVTLANASLGVSGLPAVTLSGFTAANLTDTTGGHTFTVSGWTGGGTLSDTGTTADVVTASKNAGFTLSNSALSSTDGMSLGLINFGTANLTDSGSGHTFAITGWTGNATLSDTGTGDTVAKSLSTNFTLANASLAVSGLPAITLSGFTVANLTDTTGGHTLTVSGWTGGGTLSDTGTTADVVMASNNGGFTLSNSALSLTDGMSLGLINIATANLTDSGSGHTFTITGWTENATLSDTGKSDTIAESVSTNVTLANASLAVSGLPAIALSGFTVANLTDTIGGHTFTVSGWTGGGTLSDTGTAADIVTASKNAGFTLSNSALSLTDGMSLGLINIGTANLIDSGSGHTFTITGWTGNATLSDTGTGDTVAESVSTNVVLTNSSLAASGLASITLAGISTANLTDTAGGNTFTVSGWTGGGTLSDTKTTADVVTASKNAGLTLSNSALSSTDGMSLGLINIGTANLIDSGSGHTFTITGWTGSGTLTGNNETLSAGEATSMVLTNTSLAGTGGPTLSLSGFITANLTDTSSAGGNTFNVTGWTMGGSLTGAPAGDTVTASKAGGFSLSNTAVSSGDGMSLDLTNVTAANLTDTTSGGHAFTLTGWTGGGTLSGTNEALSAAESTSVTLTNTSFGVTGGPTLGLSEFTTASLSDTSSAGGNVFTVSGWTKSASLSGAGSGDSVAASKNGSFTLTNSTLTSTDKMSLTLSNITAANLTDTSSQHTFTLTGWTGGGSLQGANETLVDQVSSSVALGNGSFVVSTDPAIALSGFTTADLTDTGSGHIFTLAGWTGAGTLSGNSETLDASASANVALTKSALEVSGLPSITLSGFTTANLTDTGSGHTFTITGWTGAGSLSGTNETVVENYAANVVLSNTSLAESGLPTIALSGFTVADLSNPYGGYNFNVSNWTGSGTLTGSSNSVTASNAAGFTLSSSALSSTDGMSLALSGITSANLTDTSASHTFTLNGWTTAATLSGTNDTLVRSVSGNVTLSNASMVVSALSTISLSGITAVDLTETGGGHNINVSGWTGSGWLDDSASASDTVTASKNAGYTLSNSALSSTDGMSLGLSNFGTASLTDTGSAHTVTVSGWTGAGTLVGNNDTLDASVSANVALTRSALEVSGLPSITLSGFTTANLTDTGSGHTFTITGWIWAGSLSGTNETVVENYAANVVLSNTSLAESGLPTIALSGFTVADLSNPYGGYNFNVSNWTGSGTLTGSSNSVTASNAAGFTLSSSALSSTDGTSLALSGITSANLTDTSASHTFTLNGWTTAATLSGTNDTLVRSVSGNVTLSNASMVVSALSTINLSGITAVNLTETGGGHNINVSGWTGSGWLDDSASASDTVTASKSAGYTLGNSALSSTDGMSLGLSNIGTASLTDTGGGHTVTVSGWTGAGSLVGNNETLDASVSANVALTRSSLAVSGLPSITLSGFTTANLTDTGSGHTFTITGWTGAGSLSGTNETVVENYAANVVLSNTSLAESGLPTIALSGFTVADLSNPYGGYNFNVSNWTGSGTLTGSSNSVTATESSNITLTNSSLTAGTMSLALSRITSANLTVTATSGNPVYVVNASAFTARQTFRPPELSTRSCLADLEPAARSQPPARAIVS